MKAGLQLRVGQNLSLTPQLQQTIRLLQLSTLEMQQELEMMLADNPFLERADNAQDNDPYTPSTAEDSQHPDHTPDAPDLDIPDTSSTIGSDTADALARSHDVDWNAGNASDQGSTATSSDDADWDTPADWETMHTTSLTSHAAADDDPPASERNSTWETLQEHLHRQALSLRLSEHDRAALYLLIESLNDDGYLEDSLGELAASLLARQGIVASDPPPASAKPHDDDDTGCDSHGDMHSNILHHLTVALRLLQTLEPIGVGARNLAECLKLQLKALHIADSDTTRLLAREVALDLCNQPLDYLARRDLRGLSKLLPYKPEHIKSAIQLIGTLEPKPGRAFAETERNIIVPDVLVRANTGKDAALRPWLVALNPAILPHVQVQEMYASALRQHKGDGAGALQQRLQEARWMVKSIQQRFDTILRVSTAIVARQQRFFSDGVLAMEPLVLRAIAEELGLHESTISRVTTAKYMATPWGTFELKYFFASGLNSDDGSSTSSTAVRAMIEQLIRDEPAHKPYSDNRLCELLQEQGIQCARRTVAKYREALRIPPAHLRKTLQ